jgi:hypothetical protein
MRGKFIIDQVFMSHLDRDHISDYQKFRENFAGSYMTCPNDNNLQHEKFRVDRGLLGVESESRGYVLDDMLKRTCYVPGNPIMSSENPLVSIVNEISLFYINPSICESQETLKASYANNISLVLFLKVGDKTVLLPGDILKEGMRYIINTEPELKNMFEVDGIDYLIAPHHGLQTSFSEYLFQIIKDNKTRLNIISEKVRTGESDENRTDVDTRYYSSDYSSGDNSLNANGVKTSKGHIVIDFDTPETEIKQYTDILDVINEFSY